MDASSHDKPLSESKECVLNNSENDVFRLGTGPFVTPQKHVADVTPNLCTPDTFKSPLDFTTVTVEQLGITPESFVKTSSGKSASSLQKARRRSTVGVRGSPETNCLIRFIAQQRSLKNAVLSPLAREPHFEGSPRLYRNASVLRERMSAFRSAFHSIQETKKTASSPSAAEADGEARISDLTRKEDLLEYQQSGFPVNSSSKRRRISSQDSPDIYLSGTKALADKACAGGASTDLAEKSPDIGSAQPGCMAAPLPELRETSQGLAVTDCVEGTRSVDALPLDTLVTPLSSGTATATRSPETPMCGSSTPSAKTTATRSPATPVCGSSTSSAKTTATRSPATPVCGSSTPSAKTFVLRSVLKKPGKLFSENGKEFNLCDDGAHLIPCPSNSCKEGRAGRENCKTPGCLNPRKRKRVTFGEDLSPEVFDESLPANTPLCKGGTPVRPRTVKTTSPLQSPVHEQFLQPNFDDKEENLENIEPPQGSFANLSLSKSSLSETPPGTNTCSSLNKDEEIICSIVRPTRTSQRRKTLSSTGVCNSYTAQAEPCKEKMSRKKSQEKKHTSTALPKKKQVLKTYRKKKKGKKGVEKCLYGPRDIASKKPLLSPIPELPEVSEATPLADCTQGTNSDDFNKRGQLEEVNMFEIPTQSKRHLPQKADPPELDPASHQSRVSEECCYLLPLTPASEGGPKTSTRDTGSEGNTRAESKCQSAKGPKPGTKMESSLVPPASVTQDHIVSKNSKPLGSPQSQDLFKAGQNLENPCEILIVSESMNLKCEKKSECLAPQGNLQGSPVSTDSKRDLNCSEDVLIQNIKEPTSHSKNVGRKCAGNGSTASGRERKWRRRTVCCGGQSSYLEQNGNPVSSCSGENFVEISLENAKLIEELSNTIEQSFQRTSSKTKVRRSTRLQKDLENTGLVWLSPSPSALQKPRRMTICTLDSRGFERTSSKEETTSSGQNPGPLPAVSGSESQGVRSSALPRKRRSLCGPTLTDANSATQPPDCKRKPSLKGESSQLP
ncbi:cell division cycle-associated protein 2 isoform X2 [Mus caroli]|uniref:Cell division cycle-associated protein 2 isoform X2 n=1 Tax=Mus caroli TaxID=10089 RepID=A0A6P5QS90_MUSCR|nr:cell division cycle-associated protein 2 isoform X2 [Mus caroli]